MDHAAAFNDLSFSEDFIMHFQTHTAAPKATSNKSTLLIIQFSKAFSFSLSLLLALSLLNNSRVYLEVDPRHPPLIQQWVEAHVEDLHYVETRHDITGRSVRSLCQ